MIRVFSFVRHLTGPPDLPDDLQGVSDAFGVVWLRMPPGPFHDDFVLDDRLDELDLPESVGWVELISTRGPLAEFHPVRSEP